MSKSGSPDPAEPREELTAAAPLSAVRERLTRHVSAAIGQAFAVPPGPGLHIVSTPIGNLADVSLRALSVIAQADVVYCEDTRHSRKLLAHFGLSRPLQAYHEHNAARERPRILRNLQDGKSVAIISDAGTPLVSDPGFKLVREAQDAGIAVLSVPGASALLAALVSAGLPTDQFFFEGFLPSKSGARRNRLSGLAQIPGTLIFYEASSRLRPMLADAAEILGERQGAVAKELTKLNESVLRGPLAELPEQLSDEFAGRGEFVVLVGPPVAEVASDADIAELLGRALPDRSVRDAVREVSEALGVQRSRVYEIALSMRQDKDK